MEDYPKVKLGKGAVTEVRDPTLEGEYESGCWYAVSNNLALCAMHNGEPFYSVAITKRNEWHAHMKGISDSFAGSPAALRTASLIFLMSKCSMLFDMVANQYHTERKLITPDEARDWFCWLHRYFYDEQMEEMGYTK